MITKEQMRQILKEAVQDLSPKEADRFWALIIANLRLDRIQGCNLTSEEYQQVMQNEEQHT